MKEDYLWDKSGKDSEIESLENALQTFRFQKEIAPATSAKILPFRRAKPRKIVSFAVAAAACLAIVGLSFAVWFQASGNRAEKFENVAKTTVHPNIAALPARADDSKLTDFRDEKNQNSKIAFVRKAVKILPINRSENRRKEIKSKVLENTKPDTHLTKEEKYAYNQLMLALSITSSKLKLVKDKVEGLEE